MLKNIKIFLSNKSNVDQNIINNNQQQQSNSNNNSPKNSRPKNSSNSKYYDDIKLIKELNYVPMIGLENIGKSCYMNSVLQSFSNLPMLTNYFLNPKNEEIIKKNTKTMGDKDALSITVEYKEVIDNLWKGKPNTPYTPLKFKKTLGKLNNLFKEDTAGDSKDLALYLIMEMHNELNNVDTKLVENNNSKRPKVDMNKTVNPYDALEVLHYFMNDFITNHNSVIVNTFYGINQSIFECQVCKQNCLRSNIQIPLFKYNYENFFLLEFPLDEVRKFVALNNYGINMGMNYQNIKEVNIDDCFNYNRKQNEMEGYCERCGSNNAKILSMTQIYSLPCVLMLIFNRGKGLQYDIKINFEPLLDLSRVVSYGDRIYELQCVIKHLGDNSPTGHFIAFCRSPVPYKNNWYCYNDNTVVLENNWKTIHDVGNTYILFYQLKNIK